MIKLKKPATTTMNKAILLIGVLLLFFHCVFGQKHPFDKYWEISSSQSIIWDLRKPNVFPHGDNIEMSGKNVSAIIHYDLNKNKEVQIKREIVYPQLTTNENESKKYRAYHKVSYADEIEP